MRPSVYNYNPPITAIIRMHYTLDFIAVTAIIIVNEQYGGINTQTHTYSKEYTNIEARPVEISSCTVECFCIIFYIMYTSNSRRDVLDNNNWESV